MGKNKKKRSSIHTERQSGGINIGRHARAGGDIVGNNKTGDSNIINKAGKNAELKVSHHSTTVNQLDEFAKWRAEMEGNIENTQTLSADEKEDLKELIEKIEAEANKVTQASPRRLEKLINTLGVMGPDIFDVAVATLVNPLHGIGLVLKKIKDKAQVEMQAQAS